MLPMRRVLLQVALMLVVAGLAGCRTASWWAGRPAAETFREPARPAAEREDPDADLSTPPPPATPTAAATPTGASPDPQALQAVMAELHELGSLDPEARDRLTADLQQTDPKLWPVLVGQFRAAAAYRRRAEESSGSAIGSQGGSPGDPVARSESGTSPQRLPTADPGLLPPESPPPGAYPATATPAPPVGSAASAAVSPPDGGVRQTSYQPTGDWQADLAAAVRAAEAQISDAPRTEADVTAHARLRMLYLLSGRRDDAMRPIPGLSASTQQFWTNQVYGLATWLDVERHADPARRAAQTKRILDEAVAQLGESAPLVVSNLAFCTQILSYGCTTKFTSYQFRPGQEVLLYAEIENFASEATPKGQHTSLRSSYQIFDGRGQRVDDLDFTTTEDYCQNARRDFFIGYQLRMPERIYPGPHTLKLTVEDLKSQKVGEASIEFEIRGANP